jgi:acyl dehydratase
MQNSNFITSEDGRYLEDYVVGAVHEFGAITVEEADIIAFAQRFDPQPFHADPETARKSFFGGIIASGWHTVSLVMRMCVDEYLARAVSLGSPGIDELRWLKPVRPGDTLSARVTVLQAKRSRSKPDRGVLRSYIEALNQRSEVVMTMNALTLMVCRGPHLK